ncbi:MAG: polysaccharide biosynthesis C-terminal domain-containing protein, partial [Bacteroidota bacterium]
SGKLLILILGLGKLFDMSTGLNNYILNYSSRFYLSYVQIVLPALLGITVSVLLIPSFGMVGAALATLSSTVFYNLLSLYFNWRYFRIQPFTIQFVTVLVLGLTAFLLVGYLPLYVNDHWIILIKSSTFASLFLFLVFKLGISPEMNQIVSSLIEKTRKNLP